MLELSVSDVAPVAALASAEFRASPKLLEETVAPPLAAVLALDSSEEARALGSESCCCIATIWLMRLSMAEILILH
jgi:hypothetical protein